MINTKIITADRIVIFLSLLIALTIPLILQVVVQPQQFNYFLYLIFTIFLYAVLASAWNIIGGMAGQFDLAMGAYLGLGAFTTGTLLIRWGITPWIGIFVSGIVSAAFAALIGFPLFGFKVKDLWYTLSSSALVQVMNSIFMMWNAVAGPTERYLPGSDQPWVYLRFNTYIPYYYIIVILLLIVIFANHRIRHSKLGFSLMALGENEDAVEVLGVNSQQCKLKALMIYAFIVGLVGGLYSCVHGYIHPSFFNADMSVEIAILGIVGGMGITYGPFMAAIFLVTLKEYLRANLSGGMEAFYLVVYATIVIVVALYKPRGIGTFIEDFILRKKEKNREITANASGE